MTVYRVDIGSNTNVEHISVNFVRDNGNDPNEFTVTMRSEHGYTFAVKNAVTIYRDGISCFSGILEHIQTTMTNDGSIETLSGRHIKVLLWRKWCERYNDTDGFWTNYYPNKIIEFLLRPSISDVIVDSETARIGWGIDCKDWIETCYPTTNYFEYGSSDGHSPEAITNRYDTIGYLSESNQTNGHYLQIDMKEVYSTTAIRVDNRGSTGDEFESYLRNYSISISADDNGTPTNWTTVATKTNNRAMNIVESWAPQNARHVRITCTANFGRKWFVSNVYVYEADNPITGISVGTIAEHLPLNVTLLSADASPGAPSVTVEKPWLFNERDSVLLGEDGADEIAYVTAVNGNSISLSPVLNGTPGIVGLYHTAHNAFLQNTEVFPMVNMEYSRRLDAIQQICKLCLTDEEEWQFEVTNAGVVNFSLRTGTDKSGTISFVKGGNIGDDISNTDYRQVVERVMVIGKGKDDTSTESSSGWVGDGDYELVELDNNVVSKEAAINVAKGILEKSSAENNVHVINVRDDYTTNSWGIDDLITVTDAISGFLSTYRVKKVTRNYNSKGEAVKIECTGKILRGTKAISDFYDKWKGRTSQEKYNLFGHAYSDSEYIIKLEAELGTNNKNRILYYTDSNASNKLYIGIQSGTTGSEGFISQSGSFPLKAGTYKAIFYAMVADTSVTDTIATLDIYSYPVDEGGILATKTIAPSDFTTDNIFQKIEIPFSLNTNANHISLRVNTFFFGKGNLYIDYYAIQSGYDILIDDPPGAPAQPTGFDAIGGIGGITCVWNANTEKDLDHYVLYKSSDSGFTSPVEVARVTGTGYYWQAPSAEIGYVRYFRITAVDRVGQASTPSAIDSATADTSDFSIAPGSIDADLLAIEERKWLSNTQFDYNPEAAIPTRYNTIYWHLPLVPPSTDRTVSSTITYSDGTTYSINANSATLADGLWYVYWDQTSFSGAEYELLTTQNYSTTCGAGKGLMATVQINAVNGWSPTILTFNSYLPTISAGVIGAVSIFSRHITGSEWIEGKMIRTASIGRRVEMNSGGFTAYGTQSLLFKDETGTITTGYIGSTTTQYSLYSFTPQVNIEAHGSALTLNENGDAIFGNFLSVRPAVNGAVNLGTSLRCWGNAYMYLTILRLHTSDPTAEEGALAYVKSSTGAKGYLKVCMMNDDGNLEWVQVAVTT
jgi:hypothetical protein